MMIKPFESQGWDVIGDIHGCFDQFVDLLKKLGYWVADDLSGYDIPSAIHPDGRKIAIVGDCTDRGPKNLKTFLWIKSMVDRGDCVYVMGNHDEMHFDWLYEGRLLYRGNGTEDLVREINEYGGELYSRPEVREWLRKLPLKVKLTISGYSKDIYMSHAGCSYEQVNQEVIWGSQLYSNLLWDRTFKWRESWSNQDDSYMVYGHTPASSVEIVHNTWKIDTACVFGEKLTAARFPEEEIISVNGWKPNFD